MWEEMWVDAVSRDPAPCPLVCGSVSRRRVWEGTGSSPSRGWGISQTLLCVQSPLGMPIQGVWVEPELLPSERVAGSCRRCFEQCSHFDARPEEWTWETTSEWQWHQLDPPGLCQLTSTPYQPRRANTCWPSHARGAWHVPFLSGAEVVVRGVTLVWLKRSSSFSYMQKASHTCGALRRPVFSVQNHKY